MAFDHFETVGEDYLTGIEGEGLGLGICLGLVGFAAGYSLWLNDYFRIVYCRFLAVYTPIRPFKYILVGLMALEGLSFIMIDGAKLLKMIKH